MLSGFVHSGAAQNDDYALEVESHTIRVTSSEIGGSFCRLKSYPRITPSTRNGTN